MKCKKCGRRFGNGEIFYSVSKVKMVLSALEMIRPQHKMRFCGECVPELVKDLVK